MTKMSMTGKGRRFEVNMKTGGISRKQKVDKATGHTLTEVDYKYRGINMKVMMSPGQVLNMEKELKRQEKSGKLYN